MKSVTTVHGTRLVSLTPPTKQPFRDRLLKKDLRSDLSQVDPCHSVGAIARKQLRRARGSKERRTIHVCMYVRLFFKKGKFFFFLEKWRPRSY